MKSLIKDVKYIMRELKLPIYIKEKQLINNKIFYTVYAKDKWSAIGVFFPSQEKSISKFLIHYMKNSK